MRDLAVEVVRYLGVLECWKKPEPEFQFESLFIVTPLLQQTYASRKDHLRGQLEASSPGTGSLIPGGIIEYGPEQINPKVARSS